MQIFLKEELNSLYENGSSPILEYSTDQTFQGKATINGFLCIMALIFAFFSWLKFNKKPKIIIASEKVGAITKV